MSQAPGPDPSLFRELQNEQQRQIAASQTRMEEKLDRMEEELTDIMKTVTEIAERVKMTGPARAG